MKSFKAIFPVPAERSIGINTCEFVVLHHTGTGAGTIKGVLDGLNKRPDFASCHYVIDENGDIYKIGNDTSILWHAGVSEWKDSITGKLFKDLNKFSIGIEIIGPVNGGFADSQRESVRDLILLLSETHKIPKARIIRHKDIAPKRKTDPADTLWNGKFSTYSSWIDSIFSPPLTQSQKDRIEGKSRKLWNGDRENDKATRLEVAVMCVRAMSPFSNPTNHGEAVLAINAGIWNGDRGSDICTRLEAQTMINRAMKSEIIVAFLENPITRGETIELLMRAIYQRENK